MPVERYRGGSVAKHIALIPIAFVWGTVSMTSAALAGLPIGLVDEIARNQRGANIIQVQQLSFEVQDISSTPGADTPVIINLPSANELEQVKAGEGTFLLMLNLPSGIYFSEGMAVGRNWIVSLQQAEKLRLFSTPETTGQFNIEFHLIGQKNRVLANAVATVSIQNIGQGGTDTASSPRQEDKTNVLTETVAPPPQQTERLSSEEENILLSRAVQLLQEGGIVSARLIFEELALQGNSKGALALARTYDPAYIAKSTVSGASPDMQEALRWYQRAAELGDLDAARRITELSSGG